MILSNTELLAIGLEANYGVDSFAGANPTSFLAPVRDSVTIKEVVAEVEDPSIFAVQATRESKFYGDYVEVSFQIPLTGKTGAAGTAPAYAALLAACGLIEIVTASTSVAYDPADNALNAGADTSFSLVYHEFADDAADTSIEHRILGIRGNFRLILNQNEPALIEFTGQGLYAAPPTATSTPPTTPSAYQAEAASNFLIVKGTTNTIGGTTACFQSMTIDLGWQVGQERCGGTVEEIYLHRSGQAPTVEYGLQANEDTILTWVGALVDATTYALVCSLTDGTDTVAITAPVFQPTGWTVNRGEGRKTVSLTGKLHGNFGVSNGADYIKITYT